MLVRQVRAVRAQRAGIRPSRLVNITVWADPEQALIGRFDPSSSKPGEDPRSWAPRRPAERHYRNTTGIVGLSTPRRLTEPDDCRAGHVGLLLMSRCAAVRALSMRINVVSADLLYSGIMFRDIVNRLVELRADDAALPQSRTARVPEWPPAPRRLSA